ncbi:hosl-1 [Pristionchus pacificus]|uniref:Hosl-1 n=1 Tax=Pristionchus pacificus TaxID=54126 RepID=A0A2A6CUN5_PRIPA|nr:hosl-1 [Pristionchus pacificus]|eukprot:PDM81942.1 hosl-1 [Pristionchus pacificus]
MVDETLPLTFEGTEAHLPPPSSQFTSGGRTKLAHKLSVDRHAIFTLVAELSQDNADHFCKCPTWTSYGGRIIDCCTELKDAMPKLQDVVSQLQEVAPRYDYDERTPGNGYRSLICIADTVLLHLVSILKACAEQRTQIMFRITHCCKELEAYATVVRFLCESFSKTLQAAAEMPSTSLFPELEGSYDKYHQILKDMEKLDASCFYGRPLGFQFSPSVSRVFRFIGIVLATYSLSWEKGHGAIGSLINSGRFFFSPEQRASRIIKVIKEADITFCKGFWNLSEMGNHVPKWFCPNMAINELRDLPSDGPLQLATVDGGTVLIPEPSVHTGKRPVKIRVLSFQARHGVSPNGLGARQPLSPYLLFHCHGGGYVATSSKSHETYLRVWAKLLNCTIVSIEYSLAPENPFPRATEECLFAYAWIVNNPALLGWTGEKLCMVGDSAGGNLIMSINLRLIQLNIARKPDGIVPVYTPFLFQYLPSPSRLLSMMDPLLHMGIVLRCVAAYTGGYAACGGQASPVQGETEGNKGHKSLQEYMEQVQKSKIDFSGGSQSIVSLVNLTAQDAHGYCNIEKKKKEPVKVDLDLNQNGETSKSGESEDTESEEDDNMSVSSVQVIADPLHIQLSTLFDSDLVDYLKNHPTTKSNIVVVDENGEEIIEGVEAEEKDDICPEMDVVDGTEEEEFHTSPSTPVNQAKPLAGSVSNNSLTAALQPVMTLCAAFNRVRKRLAVPSRDGAHKRSLSQNLVDTAALAAGHALDNLSDWLDRPTEKQKLERAQSTRSQMHAEEEETMERKRNVLEELAASDVPRDPLISPMYATDEMLRQLPPTFLIGCHLDPLLDDTIAFARKLRAAGGDVRSVDLIPSVPHGFLNFTLMSPECRDGAKLCLVRIKQALGITRDA